MVSLKTGTGRPRPKADIVSMFMNAPWCVNEGCVWDEISREAITRCSREGPGQTGTLHPNVRRGHIADAEGGRPGVLNPDKTAVTETSLMDNR